MLRSSVFGLGLKAVGILAAWGAQVLLARTVGVEAFGIYATVVAWMTVLAVVAGFGMPLAAVRFLSIYRERADWAQFRGFLREAVRLTVASWLGVAGVVLAVFAVVPALSPLWLPMAAGMPMVLLLGLSSLAFSVFLADQMPLRAELLSGGVRSVLLGVVVAGLAGLGVFAQLGDVQAAALAMGATVLAIAIGLGLQCVWLAPVLAGRMRGPAVRGERAEWMASGLSAMVSVGAFALIERLDTILLSALASPAEAGPYSVVARLALMVSVALAPVAAVVGPRGAQFLARGDRAGLQRLMSQGALLTTGLGLSFALGLLVVSPLLLGLFGAEFVLGRSLLAVLLAGQVALALAGVAGGVLAMAGQNRILMAAMGATVVLDMVLCLVLIPRFGMYGAGMATSLALTANAALLVLAAARTVRVDTTIVGGLVLALGHVRARRPV